MAISENRLRWIEVGFGEGSVAELVTEIRRQRKVIAKQKRKIENLKDALR